MVKLRLIRSIIPALNVVVISIAGVLLGDDCDLDGEDDTAGIEAGRVVDCDGNGVPDHCELKPRRYLWSTVSLDGRPRRLAAADMNGDSRLDLVAIRRTTVTVLLGREDDPFSRTLDQSAGDSLRTLALPDYDGDGFPDVVVADGDHLWTIHNDSGGDLDSPLGMDLADVLELRAVDLDGDPWVDLAVLRADAVTFLVSHGDGTWSRWRDDVPITGTPEHFAAGDLDRDGDTDIAIAASGAVRLVWNRGTEIADVEELTGLPQQAANVILADLDHDGLPEIVTATPGAIVVLPNKGDGLFGEADVYSAGEALEPDLLAAGDIEADGDTDVITVLDGGNDVLALVNAGRRLASARPIELAEPASDLILADVAGDTGSDVVLVIRDARRIGVLTGEDLVPEASSKLELSSFELDLYEGFEPHSTALEDLDGDGDTDLVTMDGEDRVLVVYNDGGGRLELGDPLTVEGTSEIIAITAVDLDGDGDIDVAAVDESLDVLALLFNRGDGTLAQGDLHDLDSEPYQVHAADLTGDGLPEIVSVNEGAGTVEVFLNRGGGEFRRESSIAVGTRPLWATSGDFDRDGATDLAVAVNGESRLAIYFNDGSGELSLREDPHVGSPSSVAAGDMDGDGDTDLVVASRARRRVTLFENDGEGRFTLASEVNVERGANAIVLPDVDRDGLLDIVTANPDDNSISVLLRYESGFDRPLHLAVGSEPRFVVHGDLDGDGRDALVSANHDSFSFTVFVHGESAPPFRAEICTEIDFYEVAAPSDAWAIYTVPASPDASQTLALFQDTSRFRDHAAFLGEFFSDLVRPVEYEELVLHEATRRYLGGLVRRLETAGGPLYGFTVFTERVGDDVRPARQGEAENAYARLREILHLGPLVYAPDSAAARAEARTWTGASVPVYLGEESPVLFRRGDADGDGILNLTDALFALNFLFLSGTPPSCFDAADANDDGAIDVTDAIVLLSFLFLSTHPLPAPSPGCGPDPTPDTAQCAAPPACR